MFQHPGGTPTHQPDEEADLAFQFALRGFSGSLEALRWARELIASSRARPAEIAIAAASLEEWDDHFLALSAMSGRPHRSARCRTGSNKSDRTTSAIGRAETRQRDNAAAAGAYETRRCCARAALVLEPAFDEVEGDLRQSSLRHAVEVFDIDGLIEVHGPVLSSAR
jgi:hypothetical protein